MRDILYLKNGTYIDHESLDFSRGNFRVGRGRPGCFETAGSIPEGADVLDCTGKYITRSFINAHHHIYSAMAPGMPPPRKKPSDFYGVLKNIWWKLDRSLTDEMVEASALAAAVDSIRGGVTLIIDHHSSPLSAEGSLFRIESALSRAGLSSVLCYELSGRDGEEAAAKGLEETGAFLGAGNQGLVGLHASFTVPDGLLEKAVGMAFATGTGIHIHAAEDMIDQKMTLEKHGKRVIERLAGSGALELKGTILAHCIHIDGTERKILSKSQAWAVQNPESNLNNGVGIFDPEGLGPRTMLGTDGMNGDILGNARSAYLTGNRIKGNTPEDIYRRFRNSHRYIGQNGFSGDGVNNLVVLDYPHASDFNRENFSSHFVYGLSKYHVDSVISDGKLIMREKEILTLDEGDVLRASRELSSRLWKRMRAI